MGAERGPKGVLKAWGGGLGHDAWLLYAAWKLRLCWNMILAVKNVQCFPGKGLVVRRFHLEGAYVMHGTNVDPELQLMNYAPLPPPPRS